METQFESNRTLSKLSRQIAVDKSCLCLLCGEKSDLRNLYGSDYFACGTCCDRSSGMRLMNLVWDAENFALEQRTN